MQDFQAIPDLARHFLAASAQQAAGGGGGSSELRSFRGYSALPPPPLSGAAQQLPVKCPRCDSTNTKFCYYNNYNLAQPRHFCRACRRYWTKGGVLRNVPVGGGCRKSKRSSSSSSSATSKPAFSKNSPSASRSSSDGSSGVMTTAAKPAAVATSAAAFDTNQSTIFDAVATAAEAPLCFQDASVVSLTSMMATPTVTSTATAPTPELLGFGFLDGSSVRYHTAMAEEVRVQLQSSHGFPPPDLVNVDPPGISCSVGGLEAADWQGGVVDPAFFDLAVGGAAAGDPGMYWSQSQWADTDPSIYLP